MAHSKSDCIPGRELLICLVIVLTGAANRGGAEAGAVDSQSHGGLHPGRRPGQLGSSDEAGGADGARRKTEERSRGHCESWLGQDGLGRAGADGEGGGREMAGRGAKTVLARLRSEREQPTALGFCGWCEVVDALVPQDAMLAAPVDARTCGA